MKTIEVKAHAKINLTLDVIRRRPDGYHDLEMVMQSLAFHDRVVLREADHGITVRTDNPAVPEGPQNLAYCAAQCLCDYCGIDRGIEIKISKHIPIAAGLAGGSSDAAAVLNGLNELWQLGLPLAILQQIGGRLGADIPFCLQGGTALARGIGEQLTVLPSASQFWVVLLKPSFGIATAEIYRNLQVEEISRHPDTAMMVTALKKGNLGAVAEGLANVLETVAIKRYPEIADYKLMLIEAGALGALMSGSGSTVFGIAANAPQAEKIAAQIRGKGLDVWVSHTT